MYYLMSDIHGHYREFKKLLEQVKFGKRDTLIILGDIVDYGEESIALLQDLMVRDNVFAIMGDHELAMLRFLHNLQKKTEGGKVSEKATADMMKWLTNGGAVTAQQIQELSEDDREALLDYLEDMEVFMELEVEDKPYVLVHAGIQGFDPDKELDDYDYSDMIEGNAEDAMVDIEEGVLVSGHTPVTGEDGLAAGSIYVDAKHIRLDCGAACGGRLGMICLETGECFYEEV